MKSNRIGIYLALTMTLCMADGDKPKQAPSQNAHPEVKPQPPSSSMIVVRDDDGALRAPNAAESLALTGAAQTSGASASQLIDQGPGRGLMLVLDPATSSAYSVVTKGPDGKLKMECVSGEAANNAIQNGRAQSRTLKEKISEQ